MNRRSVALGAVLAATLLLSGCADLFVMNYFQEFDGPPSATSIQFDSADTDSYDDYIGDLSYAMESDRFFEELSDLDRETLVSNLEGIYTSSSSDAVEIQDAALLVADLELRDTDAGETINNVVDVLMDSSSDEGGGAFDDPSVLIEGILPDGVADDATAIEAMLTDLVSVGGAYEVYGTSIGADADSVAGDVAQNAAVSIVVSAIVESGSGSPEENIAALADALANESADTLFDTEGTFADAGDAVTTTLEGDALSNILSGAGLDGIF